MKLIAEMTEVARSSVTIEDHRNRRRGVTKDDLMKFLDKDVEQLRNRFLRDIYSFKEDDEIAEYETQVKKVDKAFESLFDVAKELRKLK